MGIKKYGYIDEIGKEMKKNYGYIDENDKEMKGHYDEEKCILSVKENCDNFELLHINKAIIKLCAIFFKWIELKTYADLLVSENIDKIFNHIVLDSDGSLYLANAPPANLHHQFTTPFQYELDLKWKFHKNNFYYKKIANVKNKAIVNYWRNFVFNFSINKDKNSIEIFYSNNTNNPIYTININDIENKDLPIVDGIDKEIRKRNEAKHKIEKINLDVYRLGEKHRYANTTIHIPENIIAKYDKKILNDLSTVLSLLNRKLVEFNIESSGRKVYSKSRDHTEVVSDYIREELSKMYESEFDYINTILSEHDTYDSIMKLNPDLCDFIIKGEILLTLVCYHGLYNDNATDLTKINIDSIFRK